MKKSLSIFLCVLLISLLVTPVSAKSVVNLNISKSNILEDKLKTNYGISLDEISNLAGYDISSNMVYNNSFEFFKKDSNENKNECFWDFDSVSHLVKSDTPINEKNNNYEEITVNKKGSISNFGYSNNAKKKDSMHFKENEKYDFSFYVKNIDFDGKVYVYLNSKSNKNYVTEIDISNSTFEWKKVGAKLDSLADESGYLTIEFEGTGTLLLDFISLIPESSLGYGKDNFKYATINLDVFNLLNDLKPKYIRLPFLTNDLENYSWKDTIGPCVERKLVNNNGQTGIVEYFNLCEELDAKPIVSINTAFNNLSDAEFQNYLQNICDLIEFANGGATTTFYGALRLTNGHKEPYNIKYIELYDDGSNNFNKICNEIKSRYEDIEIISAQVNEDENDKNCNMEDALNYATNSIKSEFENIDNINYENLIDMNSTLTPSYFAQMILANNCGDKKINSNFDEEIKDVFESVTINENKNEIYIKIVNNKSSSKNINLNFDGFENLNFASNQYVSAGKKDKNKAGRNYNVISKEENLKINNNTVSVKINANSVNVIRVTYDENKGDTLFELPENIKNAKTGMSDTTKVVIPCVLLAGVLAIAAIFIIIKSKKK